MKLRRTIAYGQLLAYGANLLSVHGENTEHDRGISELIADVFAKKDMHHSDRAKEVMKDMRELRYHSQRLTFYDNQT